MRYGVHLPQVGNRVDPEQIMRHAERAEALGLSDIWLSEHVIPVAGPVFPPETMFLDPIVTLAWVAAVTRRIRLGISVLVVPMRHPLLLARALGSLQTLSNGRLILGAGVGWLEPEFDAIGIPFKERGRRMDQGLAALRAIWCGNPDAFPVHFAGSVIQHTQMLPPPSAPIPIWIGGTAPRQLSRAIRMDGWHGSRRSPAEIAPIVARLRASRPDDGFTISMRICWNGDDPAALTARVNAYEALGVRHVLIEPEGCDSADWDKVLDGVGRIAEASIR
jgi:probable F420-dependent oxidoreductase